jgi:hypothetical protein
MRNVSDKSRRKFQNKFYVHSNSFRENRAVYETTWKNIVERDRPQMAIWRMRIACWMTRAADTHSEHVILIAFPLQHGRTNAPQYYVYTFIACLVCLITVSAKQLAVFARVLCFSATLRLRSVGWCVGRCVYCHVVLHFSHGLLYIVN